MDAPRLAEAVKKWGGQESPQMPGSWNPSPQLVLSRAACPFADEGCWPVCVGWVWAQELAAGAEEEEADAEAVGSRR